METEINSFAEIDWFNFSRNMSKGIVNQIESQPKDYILKVDENQYKAYLVSEFELEELEIIKDSEEIIPTITNENIYNKRTRHSFEREVYNFEIRYSFKGSPILFHVQPSHYSMTANKIYVDEFTDGAKVFSIL